MNNQQPLLSLCIPTYNRDKFLNESINRIEKQISELDDPNIIEFIISDNCSTDTTSKVVEEHIQKGTNIRYIRNDKNLGMDGNFVSCFKKAKGKYIWLLGDDDYLLENGLSIIIDTLQKGDYGLIHINMSPCKCKKHIYLDYQKFISDISYWITFISANIVNSGFVSKVDFNDYMGTFFTLIPLYLTAANGKSKNAIVHEQILDKGHDFSRNGGYNIFDVFVTNYISIISEFYTSKKALNKEKYNLYKFFLLPHIFNTIIGKISKNYSTNNMWHTLLKHYKYNFYFYRLLFWYIIKISFRSIRYNYLRYFS